MDVGESDWFFDAVLYSYHRGLLRGTSEDTFDPHGFCTRAMIPTFLYRLEGSPEAPTGGGITDVEPGMVHRWDFVVGAERDRPGHGRRYIRSQSPRHSRTACGYVVPLRPIQGLGRERCRRLVCFLRCRPSVGMGFGVFTVGRRFGPLAGRATVYLIRVAQPPERSCHSRHEFPENVRSRSCGSFRRLVVGIRVRTISFESEWSSRFGLRPV